MNGALLQRMRFIDLLVSRYGYVNRGAVEEFFGISTPQASLDIRCYMKEAPHNITYNTKKKMYERTATYERKFL
jgi:hypothetical protein